MFGEGRSHVSLSSEEKAILVWSPDSAFFLPCGKTSEMAKDKEVATLLTWFSVQQRGKRALKHKWLECSPGKASDSESFWGVLGTEREDHTLQVLPKSLSDKGSSAPLVSCFPKRKLQECTRYRDETPCSYHPLNRKSTSHTGMYLTVFEITHRWPQAAAEVDDGKMMKRHDCCPFTRGSLSLNVNHVISGLEAVGSNIFGLPAVSLAPGSILSTGLGCPAHLDMHSMLSK